MEELLGVIASNINMQGPDGKTFRTEAAKTLLALTQDASQVDALVDGGAQAHAVATALARTREGARDGFAALANALARANAKGERPADALAVALATPRTVDAACVVAASDAFDDKSRENALAFLQNATVRPAGAAAVAAREEAVTALLKRFARRGAAAAQASWADAFAACAQNLSAAATFRTLLLRPPSRILSALLPLLLDGHVETHGAASPGKRRGVAAALRHCCHDVSAHGVLLDDCCAPQFILFALADASDIARLESDDSMALQLPGGTAWTRRPLLLMTRPRSTATPRNGSLEPTCPCSCSRRCCVFVVRDGGARSCADSRRTRSCATATTTSRPAATTATRATEAHQKYW